MPPHKRSVRTDLGHGDIPARVLALLQIEQGERYLPIVDTGWIGEERKDLQLDRVEIVYGDRSLRIRVQVFIQLFQHWLNGVQVVRTRK